MRQTAIPLETPRSQSREGSRNQGPRPSGQGLHDAYDSEYSATAADEAGYGDEYTAGGDVLDVATARGSRARIDAAIEASFTQDALEDELGEDGAEFATETMHILTAKNKKKAAMKAAKNIAVNKAKGAAKDALAEEMGEQFEEMAEGMGEAMEEMGDFMPGGGMVGDLMRNRDSCFKVLCVTLCTKCMVAVGMEMCREIIDEATMGYCEMPCCECFWDAMERKMTKVITKALMKIMGLKTAPPNRYEGFKQVRHCGFKTKMKIFTCRWIINPCIFCFPIDKKWVPDEGHPMGAEAKRLVQEEKDNTVKYCGKKTICCFFLCPCCCPCIVCCRVRYDKHRIDGKPHVFSYKAAAARHKERESAIPVKKHKPEKGRAVEGDVEKGIELTAVHIDVKSRSE